MILTEKTMLKIEKSIVKHNIKPYYTYHIRII